MQALEAATQIQILETAEAYFYGLCFVLGSLAGLFRTARDNEYVDIWNLINITMVSGFLSFSVVAFYISWSGDYVNHEFYFLGVASLVGLLGKDLQEKIIMAFFDYISKKIRNKPNAS